MRDLAVFGECAPGMAAVETSDGSMFGDNPLFNTQSFVSASDPAYQGAWRACRCRRCWSRVNSPATLERVRTYLAVNAPPQVSEGPGSSPTPPRTFGETLQIRTQRAQTLENLVYAAVALTLIVAGCSLAVAVGGGLVERKRPFSLLRVGGTGIGVLSGVVLLEAAVPLVAATLLAAAIAYWSFGPGVRPAGARGERDPAARARLLRPDGGRARHRLRRDRGDAAAAAADDRARATSASSKRPGRVRAETGG